MNNDKLRGFLEKGSDIAGGLIGTAIGLVGNPLAAIVGTALGTTIPLVLKDIIQRELSDRQIVRTAASATFIIENIQRKLDLGMKVRQDKFFTYFEGIRSLAEELFEGVLVKCMNEAEEKKINYISNIFSSTVFDEEASRETTNEVLALSESFTYRKFCILRFFAIKDIEYDPDEMMHDFYSNHEYIKYGLELQMLKKDTLDLVSLGLISNSNIINYDLIPGKASLTEIGVKIHELLQLDGIPKDDTDPIYRTFLYPKELGLTETGDKFRAW